MYFVHIHIRIMCFIQHPIVLLIIQSKHCMYDKGIIYLLYVSILVGAAQQGKEAQQGGQHAAAAFGTRGEAQEDGQQAFTLREEAQEDSQQAFTLSEEAKEDGQHAFTPRFRPRTSLMKSISISERIFYLKIISFLNINCVKMYFHVLVLFPASREI